ncbi:MAG: hypothetical protein V3T79_03520 [Candidatus Scalindua sediminis]
MRKEVVRKSLDIRQNSKWTGGTPQEMLSFLKVSDKKSYWSVDSNFYAEVNLAITNNLSTGVNVNYKDLNKTAKIKSRDNSTQRSPFLHTDDTKQLDVWIGMIYNF